MNKLKTRYQLKYRTGRYIAPSTSLLRDYSPDAIFMDEQRVEYLSRKLVENCKAFNVSVQVVGVQATSLAIAFKLKLDKGESVKSLLRLKLDLEVALASEIEINGSLKEAEIVTVSVKNMKRPMIGLKSVVESEQFKRAESPLTVAAGMDLEGKPFVFDLEEAPHLLIAGTTGSGKSVFIDDILLSILFHATPDEVRLLLIDPKYVELMAYEGIPHLLMPVTRDSDEALSAFMWIEDEIMYRYDEFSKYGIRQLESYNAKMKAEGKDTLPELLVVVDEFADLMMTSPKETSIVIDRIARLGRAAGIHLVLATQLPVANIVTSEIKADIPCRASFTVVDSRESRIILEKTGAERLLGSGDMIFSQADQSGVIHAQAAYVSDKELKAIVDDIRAKN